MSIITLAQAEAIIDAIFERGREADLRPLSVVVVEPGCKVKAFKKEDGSAMMRFEKTENPRCSVDGDALDPP